MDLFLEILKLATVGLISGFFAANMATRLHINKKWWELRVEAYKSLIEALADLNYYYGTRISAEVHGRELKKEEETELKKILDDNYYKVKKTVYSGGFLFSDAVHEALRDFMKFKNINHEFYVDYLIDNSSAVNDCLDKIVLLAKKDLSIKDNIWFKFLRIGI
ncbi:MAG: hypothetical protein HRU78_08025 [Gammaproteobacteria bacterium]|nr:MAG: hypothetical protein HRU78_08025 [Gammaproteobacteria bacterium]